MATKTETLINELKINYLTEEEYEEALANGEINDDEIYMTQSEIEYMTVKNPTGTGALSMNRLTDSTVGSYSSTLGNNCTASGALSHAEGSSTESSGNSSHAEGQSSTASGDFSHAEGDDTTASGNSAHAEGAITTASGRYSHAEGYYTISGEEATPTTQTGTTTGYACHAEGGGTVAYGYCSHAEGNGTLASENSAHAEGYKTTASGKYSHAEGYKTTASANSSHAEGSQTTASSIYSHAEGNYSAASGNSAHAEGYNTEATGNYSHAEGYIAKANGVYSHAEGYIAKANGECSHAEGYNTEALDYQHAQGHYNDTSLSTAGTKTGTTGTAFVIGNGKSSSVSNACRITYAGEVIGKAAYASTGADYAEYFEWADGNTDNEDRVGYFVTFEDGRFIRKANEDDYILGIVSGNPCVLGNHDECWMGQNQMDEWGRFIYVTETHIDELTGETTEYQTYKVNPDYDNSVQYVPRSERPEWSAIGVIGVLSVRDDGTCLVNGYCKVTDGGIATLSETRENAYRVIERVTDNIIKIVFR